MKRNILVFGTISGLIVTSVMVIATALLAKNPDFKGGMVLGYASMLVAFSFIFVGIKNYRDKQNNGFITFGKAFKMGFLISLIGSTMYVVVWALEYNFVFPDFMIKYAEMALKHAKESGATESELQKQIEQMSSVAVMYKNPFFFTLITYSEVLPMGLLITLISSLILKRKEKTNDAKA